MDYLLNGKIYIVCQKKKQHLPLTLLYTHCGGGDKIVTLGAVDQKGFYPPSIALLNTDKGNETGFDNALLKVLTRVQKEQISPYPMTYHCYFL